MECRGRTRLGALADSAAQSARYRIRSARLSDVTYSTIRFGRDLPGDDQLHLCGDVGEGKRALELGVARELNAVAFAVAGARSIAVDPDEAQLDAIRAAATEAEVAVQCINTDLADLGAVTSASIDVVVANHSLVDVDDLGRLLRQVHRVLVSARPFVISVPHPFAGVYTTDEYGSRVHPYGTAGRTIGDWFIHLSRANFRVDQILELGVSEVSPVPNSLIIRAVKEGD